MTNDEDIIKEELKIIINNIEHFPTQHELSKYNSSILFSVKKNGGINKFRKLLGYESFYEKNFWSEEKIIEELKIIKEKLGHFPLYRELDIRGFTHAIDKFGGLNKFRELLGYKLIHRPRNYWTIKNTQIELEILIKEINHFPSIEELITFGRSDLIHAIAKNDGIVVFKKLLGYPILTNDKYISKLMRYSVIRGKKSESVVKNILIDYCKQHNLSEPQYNKKLATGNVIEFVCNTNKTIGIDVTNTKSNKRNILNKWLKKDYYKHLDELWIVIFSNTITEQDYIKWNNESPPNVKIFSIYNFLKELEYSLDENTKNKIDKYNQCTFHNKEEFKEKYLEEIANNISN
jgi:hypothetical protein